MDRQNEQSFQRGKTVLVVDDEPGIRHAVSRFLQKRGYDVLVFGNGEETLSKLKEYSNKKIHVVLTDVDMPRIDGKQLVNHLATLYPGIKVIYMSGSDYSLLKEKLGVDANINFIQKPFENNALSNIVRKVLSS